MKPLYLEIEGLQSYSKKQSIDFEKLCKGGLFGIFGETGSGKSTILDAIIFSLYGSIPRMSEIPNEKNSIKNFLNSSSKKMELYFKFALGKDIYEISRKYTLKKRKDEEILDSTQCFLKKNGEIVATSIEGIKTQIEVEFGLSMSDFTRTVVLPQGKFNEFVRLRGSDKRAILENIFAMEKYGKALQEKIRNEKKTWEDREDKILQEIETLSDITEEKIGELEKEKEIKNSEIETKKSLLEEVDKDFTRLNILKDYHEKYEEESKKKEDLENKKDEIEITKARLLRGENANTIIPYIKNLKSSSRNLDELISSEKKLRLKEEEIRSQNEDLQERISEDKKNILDIKEQKKGISFDKKLEDNLGEIITIKEKLNLQYKFFKNLEKEIKDIQDEEISKGDSHQKYLSNLENLNKEYKNFENMEVYNLEEIDKKIGTYEDVIKNYEEKSQRKKKSHKKIDELDSFIFQIDEKIEKIKDEIKNLEERKRKNIASELANTLVENEPCPVCGSIHHPNIATAYSDDIKNIQEDLRKLNEKMIDIISKQKEAVGEKKGIVDNLSSLDVFIDDILVDEKIYDKTIKKIQTLKEEYNTKEKRQKEMEERKNEIDKNILKLQEKITNIQAELENLKLKKSQKGGELKRYEILIKDTEKELDKFDISLSTLDTKELYKRREELQQNYELLQKLDKKIENFSKTLEENRDLLESKNKEIEKITIDINSVTFKISSTKEEIDKLEMEIQNFLKKFNFISQNEVVENCISQEEIENYNREITDFENSFRENQVLLNSLKKNLENSDFSMDSWNEKKQRKEEIKNEIIYIYKDIEILNREIEDGITKLKNSSEKQRELKKIQKHLAMVEDLFSKFSKGEFLNFLTVKKLKGVIFVASNYIQKIYNGRYKLFTDEKCDFYVIDMWNSGAKRRVGTLSGGETFIISLCLAIALSKELQLKGRIPLEFFFLDEGFGSLDSKLLDKVMETIDFIRREEKISIGIITHLEELKSRIYKKLLVEKTAFNDGEMSGTKVSLI